MPRDRMPALFIGHGNPMNAIEDNEFHRGWADLGRRLPRPKAVLCISAHWETGGVYLTSAAQPATIHDFHGFPQALFDLDYPAPGDPALAHRLAEKLTAARARLDPRRGLDHGAWSVLVAMYPQADVPVVQLSLDTSQPGQFHFAIGRELAFLRDEGVLVLGSGNIVHNLGVFSFSDPRPLDWAVQYDAEVRKRIAERDFAALMNHAALGPHAGLAVPTPEHYLPMLYAVAALEKDEPVSFFNGKVMSSISMTSMLIGDGIAGMTTGPQATSP